LTPLVGRDEETELLLRRWARAKTDNGQMVLIAGEPGIGKSRIVAALVGDLFEYRDLGAVAVKGIAAPVPVWQAAAERR
jgi:putative protein kinase ArgK-like GTPase of G3E family